VWRWLITLACSLLKTFAPLAARLKALAGWLRQKIKTILNRWLPAKTPGQKIFRSYEAFLRLGRRSGYPRQNYETPLEYARRLQTATAKQPYPDAEINRLTSLFLEPATATSPLAGSRPPKVNGFIKPSLVQVGAVSRECSMKF